MNNKYESPLSQRYASDYMLELFSADTRYQTWRKLWIALAEAEHELGLPISEEQVEELKAHITDIDYDVVRVREKEVRHDVMAHVYAYGKVAPKAAGIIHLGATSCYLTDNADLIIYRDGLLHLRKQLINVIASLAKFGDIPVSMFTGTPKITIPIFKLKSLEKSMPISLDYDAAGFQINALPSCTGHNWSLQAGGVITRQRVGN